MSPVELRSDTFTVPDEGMRTAMARAEVGDDVWGTDPTVHALEERCATLLGFEAAVYVVSGTMGNQLALRAQVRPGEELLCHEDAHIVMYERGAAAVHGQLTTRTWSADGGLPDIDRLRSLVRPAGYSPVRTALIAVENTFGSNAGRVVGLADLRQVRALAAELGLALHCDGARIWNAHVASGTPLSSYGEVFDSMSVCLSKGLGAPIGSVVVGSAATVAVARDMRARLGGGWRQAGIIAAAGIYALDHNIERLAEDHRRARLLAEAARVDPGAVETNMVFIPTPDADAYVAAAATAGVLVSAVSPTVVRVVTHLGVTDADADHAAKVLASLA